MWCEIHIFCYITRLYPLLFAKWPSCLVFKCPPYTSYIRGRDICDQTVKSEPTNSAKLQRLSSWCMIIGGILQQAKGGLSSGLKVGCRPWVIEWLGLVGKGGGSVTTRTYPVTLLAIHGGPRLITQHPESAHYFKAGADIHASWL